MVSASVAIAHPTHVTMSQMRHNEESASIETSLQIDAHHLENAMESRTGEPFDLEKTPNADALLREYIGDRILARTGDTREPSSTPQHTIAWIGYEVEDEYAWLYFEISVPEGVDGVFISNRILFEMEPKQANSMILRHGEERISLLCTIDSPWAQIQLSEDD
jgi:hypothetical protein